MPPGFANTNIDALATTLADGVAVSTRHWMKQNNSGVFLGMGSNSAFAFIGGSELYTALRAFQTAYLTRVTDSMLSKTSRFADDRTRQILVSVAEIPIVYTPLLEKVIVNEPEMAHMLKALAWDSDKYAAMVLGQVLDKGHSFVQGGYLMRLSRALSHVMTISYGDPHPASMAKGLDV